MEGVRKELGYMKKGKTQLKWLDQRKHVHTKVRSDPLWDVFLSHAHTLERGWRRWVQIDPHNCKTDILEWSHQLPLITFVANMARAHKKVEIFDAYVPYDHTPRLGHTKTENSMGVHLKSLKCIRTDNES